MVPEMMEVPRVMKANDRIHEEMEARVMEEVEAVEEAQAMMVVARMGVADRIDIREEGEEDRQLH